jgi:hypothetical protein
VMANDILNQFKQHPDAWTHVDKILEKAQSPNTKFYALQILDEAVNVRKLGSLIMNIESMENFARRPKNGNKIIHNRFGASTIRG